jgi:hypothetical protein
MSSLNYKKKIINKFFLFIIIINLTISCIEEKDYRTPENFNKLMDRTIKFADDFNEGKTEESKSLLGLNFKINKEKEVNKKGDGYIYYELSIPYNLRGEHLRLFLEEFTDKYMKKRSHILIELKHMYIEKISGIVAVYDAKLKDKSVKLSVNFNDYLSIKNLEKKGIKHFMLQYDFQILAQVSQEIKNNKNLSIKSASINVSNHYKTDLKRINSILNFAKKYYQNN